MNFDKSDKTNYLTKDYNSMIKIVIYNSLGFYFLEFLIQYFTSQKLEASGIEIGFIYSVLVIGHLLSSSFMGYITDRTKSRTTLILIGSFGRGSSYFIIYFAIIFGSLFWIGIGTFTLGFFAGFFWIPFDTLISEKSHKSVRSFAFGKRDSAIGIGVTIGSIIGFTIFGFVLFFMPKNSLLLYIGIPFFGLSNYIAGIQFKRKVNEEIKFLDNTEIETKSNIDKKNSSKKDNSKFLIFGLLLLLTAMLFSNINGSLAKPFLNVYLLEEIESNPIIAVFGFLPGYVISLLIAPKVGEYIDTINPAIGIVVTSFFGSLLTWMLISTTNLIIFAILLTIDYTIVNSANLVLNNFLSRISLKHRGKILGMNSFFINLGNIIGPLIGGLTWDLIGIRAPFIISIFVELALIPIYLIGILVIKPHLTEKYERKSEVLVENI